MNTIKNLFLFFSLAASYGAFGMKFDQNNKEKDIIKWILENREFFLKLNEEMEEDFSQKIDERKTVAPESEFYTWDDFSYNTHNVFEKYGITKDIFEGNFSKISKKQYDHQALARKFLKDKCLYFFHYGRNNTGKLNIIELPVEIRKNDSGNNNISKNIKNGNNDGIITGISGNDIKGMTEFNIAEVPGNLAVATNIDKNLSSRNNCPSEDEIEKEFDKYAKEKDNYDDFYESISLSKFIIFSAKPTESNEFKGKNLRQFKKNSQARTKSLKKRQSVKKRAKIQEDFNDIKSFLIENVTNNRTSSNK